MNKIIFMSVVLASLLSGAQLPQEDQKFLNETQDLIEKNTASYPKVGEAINSNLDETLTEQLDSNSLDYDNFQAVIIKAFNTGFKEEILRLIEETKDESKKAEALKKVNGLDSIEDITKSLGDFDLSKDSLKSGEGVNISNMGNDVLAGQAQTLIGFSCLCAGELELAFKRIRKSIIDDDLIPVKADLVKLNEIITTNIKTLKEQAPLINKSNQIYMEKIIEAKEYLNNLKKLKLQEAQNN